jgi:hypothetical protein
VPWVRCGEERGAANVGCWRLGNGRGPTGEGGVRGPAGSPVRGPATGSGATGSRPRQGPAGVADALRVPSLPTAAVAPAEHQRGPHWPRRALGSTLGVHRPSPLRPQSVPCLAFRACCNCCSSRFSFPGTWALGRAWARPRASPSQLIGVCRRPGQESSHFPPKSPLWVPRRVDNNVTNISEAKTTRIHADAACYGKFRKSNTNTRGCSV